MENSHILSELSKNKDIFKDLLSGISKEVYLWKMHSDKWCLLEIICHLYDEEREDFRYRTKHILENPESILPSINPPAWVQERDYINQDYETMINKFVHERESSINWLQSLPSPNWKNVHHHPKLGNMTAKMMLTNWLAHDYLHIRQIIKLKFDFLKDQSDEHLSYAGEW